ncbi:MAG: DUF4491 family protein [Lachnospiraceae bacterium]|nr:DUF4491 family protein [Lachnospiraceae bacterium]
MNFHIDGLIIGVFMLLCTGIFHPIVIKTEYYYTKNVWPVFLIAGLAAIGVSLFIENFVLRGCIAILGITCIWCIVELFEQEKRVERGWFPNGRKRKKK